MQVAQVAQVAQIYGKAKLPRGVSELSRGRLRKKQFSHYFAEMGVLLQE